MADGESITYLVDGKHLPRVKPSIWVYFVKARALGLIKIGRARDVLQRFSALQVGSPDKLELMGVVRPPNAEAYEADLHHKFRHQHSHGEWFQPSEYLEHFIAENAVSLEHDRQRLVFDAFAKLGEDMGAVREEFELAVKRGEWPPPATARIETPREIITLDHPLKPRVPEGVVILGTGRKAALARYKAARGIVD